MRGKGICHENPVKTVEKGAWSRNFVMNILSKPWEKVCGQGLCHEHPLKHVGEGAWKRNLS